MQIKREREREREMEKEREREREIDRERLRETKIQRERSHVTKSDCISISQTPREPTEVSQRAAGSVADSSSTTESGVNL